MVVNGKNRIQVVVPVYKAQQATAQCLTLLLKHNKNDEVVIIDDGSDDAAISSMLSDFVSQSPHWQLFVNPENVGFVKTANRGLKLSFGHSLLLNTDTLVSAGWLQRFKECLRHVPDLATATPWSNNAEICSWPDTLQNNPIPTDIDALAGALNQSHQPVYPELPTAVGFCMLITAQAKQKIGYFNEAVFGHGYGEENDYSLRATAYGLRNVLVDNAYVAHVGNQSFVELGLQPNQKTMQRLLAIHPEYSELIDDFIKKDPLGTLRQSITDKIGRF